MSTLKRMFASQSTLLLSISGGITLLLVWLVGVRLLRLVAVLQQKEYRFDRLRSFWGTPAGKREFLLPVLLPLHWRPRQLKHPRMTPRVLVVLVLTLSLVFCVWLSATIRVLVGVMVSWQLVISTTALVLLCVLFFLPVFVLVATLPSAAISFVITRFSLQQARQLLSQHHPRVLGITGSYGKTSTKLLSEVVLSSTLSVCATPGSLNTKYAVSQFLLQQYRGQPECIIEYAAYTKGEIATLAQYVPPSLAVITGLSQQHLELFGSLSAIVAARRKTPD